MSMNLALGFSEINLRMNKRPGQKIYEFGEFRLDSSHRMLYRGDHEVPLVPKAVETLLALIERPDEIVTKDELLSVVWPDAIVEESNIFLYLSLIRKALGTQRNGAPWIETLRRRGYRFNGLALTTRNGTAADAGIQVERSTTVFASSRQTGQYLGSDVLNGPASARAGIAKSVPHYCVASEAQESYLSGVFISRDNPRQALDHFVEATILDPSFAMAFFRVSQIYFKLGCSGEIDPNRSSPLARSALKKALELDSTLIGAHLLSAQMKQSEFDWVGANRDIDTLIELAPTSSEAHLARAERHLMAGRIDDAIAQSELRQAHEPLAVWPKIQHGWILYYGQRFNRAISRFKQIIELVPNQSVAHAWLGCSYAAKGDYEHAIDEYQLSSEFRNLGTTINCYLGFALARSGLADKAIEILNHLRATRDYVSPAALAILYSGLRLPDEVFRSLEEARIAKDGQLLYVQFEPHYRDFHDDPRFDEFLARIGLSGLSSR